MGRLITLVCCASTVLLTSMASAAVASPEGEAVLESSKKDNFNKQSFYTQFLGRDGNNYGLENLSSGEIKPGIYYLTLYVNNRKISAEKIRFAKKDGRVAPCIDMNILLIVNIDSQYIDEKTLSKSCVDIGDIIPGAIAEYNDEDSILSFTIPQKYLMYVSDDYINPELWDDGVMAFKMSNNSNLSSFTAHNQVSQQTFYTGMQATLNVGAWRINTRDNIYLSNVENNNLAKFTHGEFYAYRAIRSLQSKFAVGNISTSGDFFDSTYLTGVTLATNDQMLPFSMRNYIPKIQGVAETNATVTLIQAGGVIYETQVPPGEFVLHDFYPGSGGDIQVNIRESDGRITSFTVPYSSVPQLVRQGYRRYSLTLGEIRNSNYSTSPRLFEGTWQYGLDNNITIYSGLQYTDIDYKALKFGAALNTPVGAFSSDLTRSFNSEKNNVSDECKGFCHTALQLNYNKMFDETSTGINASLKEVLGKGYTPLANAIHANNMQSDKVLRTRLDLNLSQSLPKNWGGLYVGGQISHYWDRPREKTFQASYRNAYNRLTYSLSFIQRDDYWGKKDRQVYLNFTFPFQNDVKRRTTLLASGGYNSNGATMRTAISGTAGEQQQYGFNTYVNTRRGEVFDGGASLTQTSDTFTASASISQSGSTASYGLGFNSGLLIHAGGVNYSQGMSDSVAIIHAPDARGIKIRPDQRASIQNNGFGILRSLIPWQYNEIYLDPQGSRFSVDIEDFYKRIVPTEGAILLRTAETKSNPMSLLNIRYRDGKIPFATPVKDRSGKTISLTGQNSSVMLPYPKETALYTLSWREKTMVKACFFTLENVTGTIDSGDLTVSVIDCIPSAGDKSD